MNRWRELRDRGRRSTGPGRKRSVIGLEVLEGRALMTVQASNHVLLLSVDGLHQADVQDPALAADLTTLRSLIRSGVSYGNASTTSPSDSFPGTLAYLTGAHPGTTGVFYDDSYDRTLFAPGSNPATATPGTEVIYAEPVDRNPSLISGGGNFNATSIDPAKLPLDAQGRPVYPNQFLKVNTIFDVAHQAGLYTAFSDKHPAYQIVNGNNSNAVNDFYGPEINSTTALFDPVIGKTVDANALLAANPFTDVSKYILVDASTDPMGASDPNLINDTTHNVLLTEKYDELKVQAILNEIDGLSSRGAAVGVVPNIFGMNFQAVSVAQKYYLGGITPINGKHDSPSAILQAAMAHTDASLNRIVSELKNRGLWGTTMLVVTAKHGQDPRVGVGGLMDSNTIPNLLAGAGVKVGQVTQDDVSLIWLRNQSQTSAAVAALKQFQATGTLTVSYQGQTVTLPASQVIDKVISGPGLPYHNLGNPLQNSRTPDVVVTLKTGFIWVGNTASHFKRAEHGGFSTDDTHVPLVLAGGLVHSRTHFIKTPVQTTQIAVTSLLALGLNPNQLQGAVIERTKALPGLRGH